MTLHRTCPRFLGMSARHARRLVAPLLPQVSGIDVCRRVAFRAVESSRGAFVFGTLLSWDSNEAERQVAAGVHVAIDDEENADRVLAPFLEMVLDRVQSGVLVHDGAGDVPGFLARHSSVPEVRALGPHIEHSLDISEVFRVLMPEQSDTLEAIAEHLAGIPRAVCGERLHRKASAIEAPRALVRMAEVHGGPHAGWDQVLRMRPSEWADEWVADSSAVWESLLAEDGALHLTRLRELDRWLIDEVLAPTSEWVC
jgi:hypothetical protein